jgi:hypothetical protein
MKLDKLLVLVGVALLSAGCLVQVEDVEDPGPAFAEARREAERVQGRPGPPDTLQVLVYDRGDGKLVRASVPMWIVETMDDEGIDIDDETAERVSRHLRLDDLKDAPLGPLVEVEEEDGDQVLVWLK